jgi:hypothetical protein
MAVAMPTLFVGVRFGAGAESAGWALGSGAFPTQIGAPDSDADYSDLLTRTRKLSIKRGKSREIDRYRAGQISVVFGNDDRALDPLNLAAGDPYVTSGVTNVKPGRRLRVKATHPTTAVETSLFNGTVREWDLNYRFPSDGTATARGTDLLTDLARTTVNLTTSAATSDVAANEILNDAGVVARSVGTGDSSLQATSFANSNALAALDAVTLSEQGARFVGTDGLINVENRNALLSDATSRVSQGTFGPAALPIAKVEIAYESDLITNSVVATRAGGSAQTATDATSVTTYGPRTDVFSSLMISTDASALDLARYHVARFKEAEVRVRSIQLKPRTNAGLMTQALTRGLRDRITVEFTPPGGGTIINTEMYIAGIQHEFDGSKADLTTTFTLESVTGRADIWVLGTGALGTTTVLGF